MYNFLFTLSLLLGSVCFSILHAEENMSHKLMKATGHLDSLKDELIKHEIKLDVLKSIEKEQPPSIYEVKEKLIDRQKRLEFIETKIYEDKDLYIPKTRIFFDPEIKKLGDEIRQYKQEIIGVSPIYLGIEEEIHSLESTIIDIEKEIDKSKEYVSLLSLNQRLESALNNENIGSEEGKKILAELSMFPNSVQKLFINNSTLEIGGVETNVKVDTLGNITLGDTRLLRQGVNYISNLKRKAIVWYEGLKLLPFSNPYKSSYAIIAAVDDYTGKGFKSLGSMVNRAEEFRDTLIGLGFPSSNIKFLPDDLATSTSFEAAIKEFWKNGRLAGADRLLIYFGGHGTKVDKEGFLVMSDYKKSDSYSGYSMNNFLSRHFYRLDAHQVLVLLDSCSSGLAIEGAITLSDDMDTDLEDPNFSAFKNRVIIEEDTKEPSRSIFVAGTGDREALYRNGGIFTKALITGMKNFEADGDKNGVIQMDEIKLWVTNQVRAVARITQSEQTPSFFHVPQLYGSGKMLFMRTSD